MFNAVHSVAENRAARQRCWHEKSESRTKRHQTP